jgi:hypothetical protein
MIGFLPMMENSSSCVKAVVVSFGGMDLVCWYENNGYTNKRGSMSGLDR